MVIWSLARYRHAMPTLAELAEDTIVYLLPRPTFEQVDRGDLVYDAGLNQATVHRIRVGDVREAVEWARTETTRCGLDRIEWWAGWSATPADLGEQLRGCDLVPGEVPALTGMTCSQAPPAAASEVTVERVTTVDDYLEAIQVDWEVWELSPGERERRHAVEVRRFAEIEASGVVHHFSALLDGRRIGFGRAIDMDGAVALMGGAVLPEARGRGVYRALVRARWDHSAARGTPLLVVQAGNLSAPILESLGFERHGEVRLYVDRL
jgi:ribosomal protein S18 acetylase RimI-like enzyme